MHFMHFMQCLLTAAVFAFSVVVEAGLLSKGSITVSPDGQVRGKLMRRKVTRSSAALSLPKTTRRSQQMRNVNINAKRSRQSLTTVSPQEGAGMTTMAPATATTMDSAITTTADASAITTTPIETTATNPGEDESGTGAKSKAPVIFHYLVFFLAVAAAYMVFKYQLRQPPRDSDTTIGVPTGYGQWETIVKQHSERNKKPCDGQSSSDSQNSREGKTCRDDKAQPSVVLPYRIQRDRSPSNNLHPSQSSHMARVNGKGEGKHHSRGRAAAIKGNGKGDSGEGEPVVKKRSSSEGKRPQMGSSHLQGNDGSLAAPLSNQLSRSRSASPSARSKSPRVIVS